LDKQTWMSLLDRAAEEGMPWCSTLTDEIGKHVNGQGKWGNCGPDCPLPGKQFMLKVSFKMVEGLGTI
jgi:hypothetical protein